MIVALVLVAALVAGGYYIYSKVKEEAAELPTRPAGVVGYGFAWEVDEAAQAIAEAGASLVVEPSEEGLLIIYSPEEVAKMTAEQRVIEADRLKRMEAAGALGLVAADIPSYLARPGTGANPFRQKQWAVLEKLYAMRQGKIPFELGACPEPEEIYDFCLQPNACFRNIEMVRAYREGAAREDISDFEKLRTQRLYLTSLIAIYEGQLMFNYSYKGEEALQVWEEAKSDPVAYQTAIDERNRAMQEAQDKLLESGVKLY